MNEEAVSVAEGKSGRRTDCASCLIPAEPKDVFASFRDGETIMNWLPPDGMAGRALAYEFRVGGHYRIELRFEDGRGTGKTTGDSDVSTGCFLEIVTDRLIRQTVEFESDDKSLSEGMTMTWFFSPSADGTQVTVMAENVPPAITRDDHLKGLNGSLQNLAAFVRS